MSRVALDKAGRVIVRKLDALVGRVIPLQPVLEAMSARPYELPLELTNLCNANCVFCPYRFQTRVHAFMSDEAFEKAVADFAASGGGAVGLTPVVGDACFIRSSSTSCARCEPSRRSIASSSRPTRSCSTRSRSASCCHRA